MHTNSARSHNHQLAIRKGDGPSLDRATLSSTQLYKSAAREGIQLRQDEKDRVSADYLYLLAITKKLGLSQQDRDRLKPLPSSAAWRSRKRLI